MELNYGATDHTPTTTFTTPPNVSNILHQSSSGWGYNGSYDEMSELMRREMEKAKMREEIMMEIENERTREEIIVTRRLLEAQVRRELSIEKALAFHRGGDLFMDARGFHAPLSPLDLAERPIGERFANCLQGRLGEGDGRPVGERFATSLDGRLGMPLELRPEFGGLGTGPQTSLAPEAKLHLGNGKHKEQIIFPAKPIQDVNVRVLPSAGSAKEQFRQEWSCALCQVSASSEQGLNEHLQGKWHKAKAAGLRKKPSKFKIGWFTENAPIVGSKDASPMSSKVSKKSYQTNAKSTESGSQSQDSDNTKRKDYSFDSANNNEAMVMERKNSPGKKNNKWSTGSPIVRTQAHKKSALKFWCEMCQIGTDTEKVMKIHRTGKKHLDNKKSLLRFWCDVCQIGTDTEEVMEKHLKGNKHLDNKKSLLRFWCDVCQIGTDTEEVMEKHLKGKKHLDNKKSLLRFWCDVCQIGTYTEEVMEKHLKGNKHLANVEKRCSCNGGGNGELPPQ